MRLLFINDGLPYPPDSGDRIRVYNLLRRVAVHHEVWLAAVSTGEVDASALAHLREFCAGVEVAPVRRGSPLSHLPGLARYALHGWPLELKFHDSAELRAIVARLTGEIGFDIVQIEHSLLALYLEAVQPRPDQVRILDLINVGFSQYQRIARRERRLSARLRTWLLGRMMRRWEPAYAGRFDRCLAMSEDDRRLMLAANPRLAIDIVPNGMDTHALTPLDEPTGPPALLFVGTMNYPPCADAVIYFCREILPRVRQTLGPVELWIVGKNPPPEVQALAGDGVHVTGYVEDVTPYYRRSTVAVVPLLAGGGTRLKILEAMALGRPVVSTGIGCEGLDVIDGEHLLVADTAEAFAAQTVRLCMDGALRSRLVANARRLVTGRYDWDAIAEQLIQLYAAAHEVPAEPTVHAQPDARPAPAQLRDRYEGASRT